MTEDQINKMVDRFLTWQLPEDFRPDAGISFKADFNEHTAHPMKHKPTGTNLFTAAQATEMVRHMVAAEPSSKVIDALVAALEEARQFIVLQGYNIQGYTGTKIDKALATAQHRSN